MSDHQWSADVLVIGLGAAGSAALSFLARAGVKVVGIDRYAPPHAMGSSHGDTRMLRTAYSEGAAYVPMVKRSIDLWRDLEARTGQSLFHQTGVVYCGPGTSRFLAGARASAQQESVQLVDIEMLDPALAVPAGWQSVLDVAGGYLDAEASVAAFLQDAISHGAAIVDDCACRSIDVREGRVAVATTIGIFNAGRVIVAAGAWASELMPWLRTVTHIERRVQHWFKDDRGRYGTDQGFRPFLVTTEDDAGFYGFPANRNGEVKVAEHFLVDRIASPDKLHRSATAADLALIRPLVSRFLPELGEHVRSSVCMYPMSRDEHFILARDFRPQFVIGAGLSGHGFKFAPVIGEALANFALDRPQEIDVDFFSLSRFEEFR
jgi:monomeric sarcosine oxidase